MQGGECVMFPFEKDTEELEEEEEIEYYPKEYDIDFSSGKLNGKIAEGARALAVWAYFTIKIERYRFVQYSWEYGSEINDLIGYTHSDEYVKSEINRLITECLEPNAYITGITDLEVDRSKETMNISLLKSENSQGFPGYFSYKKLYTHLQ